MPRQGKKSGGAPRWMTTFADLSTLLLTFFVLLLSMAQTDIQEFKAVLGSIKDAFGVQTEAAGMYQPIVPEKAAPAVNSVREDLRNADYVNSLRGEPAAASEGTKQEVLREEAQRRAEEAIRAAIERTGAGDQMEVISGKRGIRIRVKGALLFEGGEAELTARAQPFLDDLVLVLDKFPYHLLVEGHTDSQPISTPRFPSNWELSGARASAVLRYLLYCGIPASRLASVGLADNYPLASNDTPDGRMANRRVEFVLTDEPFRQEID